MTLRPMPNVAQVPEPNLRSALVRLWEEASEADRRLTAASSSLASALARLATAEAQLALLSPVPGQVATLQDEVAAAPALLPEVVTGTGTPLNVISKSGNYTALIGDDVILCDASGGVFTITLPSLADEVGPGLAGRLFYGIKKIDASGNAVTIDGNGALIDGDATVDLTTQYESLTLVRDGSNWHVL